MKVIAMYLPQFHRVEENDKWWGKGFTDWVSTKSAQSFFENHYQPHIPLDNNYYDLSEKKTMQWQAELMHQYGIDGMCMYHYWFKDGRRILEKPAENLLKWEDINMPFCFCWANETWARSWSGLKSANAWADNKEPEKRDGEKAVLLEQDYGDLSAWQNHFYYLLPFFKDKRYLKQDGKPIFVIYKSMDIACLADMAECFNELARQNGFDGIYFICANVVGTLPSCIDAALIHEPQNSVKRLNQAELKNEVATVDYKKCWETLLSSVNMNHKTYYEGFVSYDDTPRRGINGTVITGASPQIFGEYFTKLMAKTWAEGNELVFVNAWNEWGEGMHLEPDEKFKMGYLEQIQKAKKTYKDISIEELHGNMDLFREIDKLQSSSDKFERYLNVLNEWFEVYEHNVSIVEYFENNNIKKIAIYGYNLFAKHLIFELRNSDIEIVCLIDKQKDKLHIEEPVLLPGECLPDVDVIIVAAFYYFNDIRELYKEKGIRIISVESIIQEIDKNLNI